MPSLSDEHAYIKWFVENDRTVEYLRAPYKPMLAKFAEACAQSGTKMLCDHQGAQALFNHIANIATDYQNQLRPFIEKNGGLGKCSPAIQNAAVNMLMNIAIGVEFLEKKYQHKESLDLFRAIR